MRQLHVVSVSPDGKSLLLSGTSKNGRATYRVPINARLRTAINGDGAAASPTGTPTAARPTGRGGSAEPRAESALSPREIQARLRAGDTVENVARAAGVALERVETYYGPVLSERIQVIDAAQAATMTRPRWGDSARPLGEAVNVNLAKTASLREETIAWTARRRPDTAWVVRLEFTARGRRRVAEWEWEPRERELTPLDPTATTLGYVEPRGGARNRPAARTATPRKQPARKQAARKQPAARRGAARGGTGRATSRR